MTRRKTFLRVIPHRQTCNEESTRHTGIYVCREPVQLWSTMWKQMQWYQ